MAHDYPHWSITGLDLLDVQPSAIKPKNAHFVQGDVLDAPFPDQSFDYIHLRTMASGSITVDQWPGVLEQVKRLLKPGGVLEMIDCSGEFDNPAPSHASYWEPRMAELLSKINLDYYLWKRMGKMLKTAGYQRVQTLDVSMPIGPWVGPFGVMTQDMYFRSLELYRPGMVGLGVVKSESEFDKAVKKHVKEIVQGKVIMVLTAYVAQV
jgi:ubiquinone/menaquinone biosynthesis C-methylase UbiE